MSHYCLIALLVLIPNQFTSTAQYKIIRILLAEMQKAADIADITMVFFQASGHFLGPAWIRTGTVCYQDCAINIVRSQHSASYTLSGHL